jgi:hypothetical protein
MVPKWQHTTDQGMREGGAAVVLDHNEGRRDKLLTACVEIGKYHKGKGIGVKRQRRPKEYKWKAETLAELLHDVPQMQRLARARLRFHAAAKVRRRDFVVDRRARHAAGELQPTASIPIPFLEPRAGLSLGLGMDGSLINTVDLEAGNEFVRQVPPSPFTAVDLVRRRAEVEPISQRTRHQLVTPSAAMLDAHALADLLDDDMFDNDGGDQNEMPSSEGGATH